MAFFWTRGWISTKGTHANNFTAGQDLLEFTFVKETFDGSNIVIEALSIAEAIGFVISPKGALLNDKVDVLLGEWKQNGGAGAGGITLQVDGTPNTLQTLLNLIAGTNITLTDDGLGGVTIDASGGSLPALLQNHFYVGDAGNLPADAGTHITYTGIAFHMDFGGVSAIELSTNATTKNSRFGYNTGTLGDESTLIGYGAGLGGSGDLWTVIGVNAGGNTGGAASGARLTAVGRDTAAHNVADLVSAFGPSAAAHNTGANGNFHGFTAGFSNSGADSQGFGNLALNGNVGQRAIAIGQQSGFTNSGDDAIAIGWMAGISNTFDNVIQLGKSILATANNQFIVGSISDPIINWSIRGINYQMPLVASTAGQVLTDVLGNQVLSWETPSGGTPLSLQVDGTPNVDQTLLNLISGTGITLTDDGLGGITIDGSTSPIYPLDHIPFGDGATPGGITSVRIQFDPTNSSLQLTDPNSNVRIGSGNFGTSLANGVFIGNGTFAGGTSGTGSDVIIGVGNLAGANLSGRNTVLGNNITNTGGGNIVSSIALGSEVDMDANFTFYVGAQTGAHVVTDWVIRGLKYKMPSAQNEGFLYNSATNVWDWRGILTDGVTVTGDGTVGNPLVASAGTNPIYPLDLVPFGDGVTPGGITDSRFTYNPGSGTLGITVGSGIFMDNETNVDSTVYTKYQNISAGTTASVGVRFYNDVGLKGQILALSSTNGLGNNKLIFDGVDADVTITARTTHKIDFAIGDVTDAAAVMRIHNNGNVSIGANPSDAGYLFDVNGTFHTVGVNTMDDLAGVGTRMVVANATGVLSTGLIIPSGANFLIGQTSGIISNPAPVGPGNETFLGEGASGNQNPSSNTISIGNLAGVGNTGVDGIHIGYRAGVSGGSSNTEMIFIGTEAGYGIVASQAGQGVFLGTKAGKNATNATHAIFIGNSAGENDTVDSRLPGDYAILIGNNATTSGFVNSIAIGNNAANTVANQFLVEPLVTDFSFRGLNYSMPSVHAVGFMANDGIGTLTWAGITVDGVSITGDGTPGNPLIASSGANTLTQHEVAFGDAANLMTSNPNFTYNLLDDRFSFASTVNTDQGIFYNGTGAPNPLNAHKGLGMDFFGVEKYTLGNTNANQTNIEIDNVAQSVIIGGGANDTKLVIGDGVQTISLLGIYNFIANSSFFAANFSTGVIEIGDVSGSQNSTMLSIDDAANTFSFLDSTGADGITYAGTLATGGPATVNGLTLDVKTGKYYLGGAAGGITNSNLFLDDANELFRVDLGAGGIGPFLELNRTTGLYSIGAQFKDNLTYLQVNDSAQIINLFGQYNAVNDSSFVQADFGSGIVSIGDVSNSQNGYAIIVDDGNQQIYVGPAIYYTGSIGTLKVEAGIGLGTQGFSGNFNIPTNVVYVDVDTTSVASIPTLPDMSVYTNPDGITFVISDYKGNAGTNNITVTTQAGNTIQGGTTYVLNQNYQSITVHARNSGAEWVIS